MQIIPQLHFCSVAEVQNNPEIRFFWSNLDALSEVTLETSMKSHMVVLHSAIVSAIVELYISFDIVHSWNLQLFCVIKLNSELFDLYYWVWTIVELSVVWHNEPQFSSLLKKTIDQTNCIFSFDTYIFSSAKGVWTFQYIYGNVNLMPPSRRPII